MFRIEPNMPAAAYKTYSIAAPRATHWRPATCAEAQCDAYLHGWKTVIDEATELGMGQAYYIREQSGRRFREERLPGGRTEFYFEPGQRCFRSGDQRHYVRLDRQEIYVVRDGDHRGNPRGTEPRRHTRARDWTEDFALHQDRIARQTQRG
jgi:hypothetical protein